MAVVLSFSLGRVLCLVMSFWGQAYFDPSFGYFFFVGEVGRVGLLFDK